MNQDQKQQYLQKSKEHVASVSSKIMARMNELSDKNKINKNGLQYGGGLDKTISGILYRMNERRLTELSLLAGAPYFVRCDIFLNNCKEIQTYYFSKFFFDEENIYSWVSPIASIRFEKPGKISYAKPDGSAQTGTLVRKDQYMIVNGKIIFFAKEEIDSLRELVHQEHFTFRKNGFMLPEIIAQMEKVQDQVIRAHHAGPFLISGPAGSGKTTLALHRVAYLLRSPETSNIYMEENVVVFVQDAGTKKYFSQLLPELGIHNVQIITFYEWASSILDFK